MSFTAFRVLEIHKAGGIKARFHLPSTSEFFAGHFPSRPILPGVGMLTILDTVVASIDGTSGGGAHIKRLRRVKFLDLVEAGGDFTVEVQGEQTVPWYAYRMSFGEKTVSYGSFVCGELTERVRESSNLVYLKDHVRQDIDLHLLIPQRPPMQLVEGVLDVNDTDVSATGTVGPHWPAVDADSVPGVFLVETIAQSAAVHTGWLLRERELMGGAGYLVGIPEASLKVARIPVGTSFHTQVRLMRRRRNFAVYEGSVFCGQALLATAQIQAFKP